MRTGGGKGNGAGGGNDVGGNNGDNVFGEDEEGGLSSLFKTEGGGVCWPKEKVTIRTGFGGVVLSKSVVVVVGAGGGEGEEAAAAAAIFASKATAAAVAAAASITVCDGLGNSDEEFDATEAADDTRDGGGDDGISLSGVCGLCRS